MSLAVCSDIVYATIGSGDLGYTDTQKENNKNKKGYKVHTDTGIIVVEVNLIFSRNGKPYFVDSNKCFKFASKRVNFYYNNFKSLDEESKKDTLLELKSSDEWGKLRKNEQEKVQAAIQDYGGFQKNDNLMEELFGDMKPDIGFTVRAIRPFEGVIGTVFGVICIFLILFVTLTTAIDLAVMVLPFLQGKDIKNNRWISWEARVALKKGELKEKESLIIYFKYKLISLVVLAVAIDFLLDGVVITKIMSIIEYF